MSTSLDKFLNNPVTVAGTSIMLAAALVLALSLTTLFTTLFYNPEVDLFETSQEQSANQINLADIVNRNFFGFAKAEPEIAIENLPETKLELTLRGAFAAQQEHNAGAIIADDKSVAQYYSIGDKLPGDVTLQAVYPDRVVLARSGLLETLYFPEEINTSGIDSRTNNRRNSLLDAANRVDDNQAKQRRDAIRKRIKELRGKNR